MPGDLLSNSKHYEMEDNIKENVIPQGYSGPSLLSMLGQKLHVYFGIQNLIKYFLCICQDFICLFKLGPAGMLAQ